MMHSPRLHMLRIVSPPPSLGAHPLAGGTPARGALNGTAASDTPQGIAAAAHGRQEFIA